MVAANTRFPTLWVLDLLPQQPLLVRIADRGSRWLCSAPRPCRPANVTVRRSESVPRRVNHSYRGGRPRKTESISVDQSITAAGSVSTPSEGPDGRTQRADLSSNPVNSSSSPRGSARSSAISYEHLSDRVHDRVWVRWKVGLVCHHVDLFMSAFSLVFDPAG